MSRERRAFLSRKFPLGKDPDVLRIARTEARRNKETLRPNNADNLVENYLGRFRSILERTDQVERDRGVQAIKRALFSQLITRYEDIPESYWKSYEANLRSLGRGGDWADLTEDQREEKRRADTAPLLEDQQDSLEEWVDYFISDDSTDISDELKYWAFRSLTQLQAYEPAEGAPHIAFDRRSKGSLKKYPDLNREALRYVVDAIEQKIQSKTASLPHDNAIEQEDRERFEKYLEAEKFADLYAWATELVNPIPEHLLPITAGEWQVYPQGSDSKLLAEALRGKGTGLCIAGRGAARHYIEVGDLYVFFSQDETGQPTFPRAAIHATNGHIIELRGIASKQNLDPYIAPVVQAKLGEFNNGQEYEQQAADMRQLTVIEQKTKKGEPLNQSELAFLYEIDRPIQGFGYNEDPRIIELRAARDAYADAPIIFDCDFGQIARSQSDVRPDTKVYIGPLYAGIFKDLAHIEYIYTKFPEKKIENLEFTVGGMSANELIAAMTNVTEEPGVGQKKQITKTAKSILDNEKGFIPSQQKEHMRFVRLTVGDLGFRTPVEFKDIIYRAASIGLELCPSEAGPYLRVHLNNQTMNEWIYMGMSPLPDSENGTNRLFRLSRNVESGDVIDGFFTDDYTRYSTNTVFIFRNRQAES